jgi:hypothetical protein
MTAARGIFAAASLLLAAVGCSPAASAPAPAVVFIPATAAAVVQAPPAPVEEPRRPDRLEPDPRLDGTWDLDDSTAVVRIRVSSGRIHVDAWDSDDGQTFLVEDVKWDGKRLSIQLFFPPTKHRTDNAMVVVDRNTLEGERSGGATGHMIWRRMNDAEIAASKPPPP